MPSASIAITKVTDPAEEPGLFAFSGDLGEFTLSGGDTESLADLDPGDYTVVENTPPEGWTLTDISCSGGATTVDLAAGSVAITVADGDAVACTFTNTLEPGEETPTETTPIPPQVGEPAVDIEKATNGLDADAAPGPMVMVGGPVLWTYVVTNTGDVELTGVTVVDDMGTPADPSDDVTVLQGVTLAPGEQTTAELRGVAAAGQYVNIAVVTTIEGPTDSDASHHLGEEPVVPALPNSGAGGLADGGGSPWSWLAASLAAVVIVGGSVVLRRRRRAM